MMTGGRGPGGGDGLVACLVDKQQQQRRRRRFLVLLAPATGLCSTLLWDLLSKVGAMFCWTVVVLRRQSCLAVSQSCLARLVHCCCLVSLARWRWLWRWLFHNHLQHVQQVGTCGAGCSCDMWCVLW
jgi:hypothetical protein